MKGLPGNRQPFFYAGKRMSHGFETTNVVSFFLFLKELRSNSESA